MDRDAVGFKGLRELGSSPLHAETLTALASFALEHGRSSGDEGYTIVGETLSAVDEWWLEHEETSGGDGVPTQALDAIADLLRRHLPLVLDALDEGASIHAKWLRADVAEYLTGSEDWQRRGWVTNP